MVFTLADLDKIVEDSLNPQSAPRSLGNTLDLLRAQRAQGLSRRPFAPITKPSSYEAPKS